MQEKNFTTYEYKTVTVKTKDKTKAADAYGAFGWEITAVTAFLGGVTLSMRRDRKQRHRQELIKLERQAEELTEAIDGLHSSKTLAANVFSYIFGIFATLMLGGGMCLTLLTENDIPAFAGGIVLGVAGIVLCSVNYFIYKKIVLKKTKEALPLIDETEEKLANVLEQGNDLLSAETI